MSAAFDTLRLARSLRDKAHFTPEQAEGLADAIAEAMQGDIATKADIAAVRADLREVELRLRADMAGLRADLAGVKNDTIRWVVGMIGFQSVVILGAAVALARAFAH